MAVTGLVTVMLAKELHPEKNVILKDRHRHRDRDDCQRLGVLKGFGPNGRHRLMDSDAYERLATFKNRFPNGHPTVWRWAQFLVYT